MKIILSHSIDLNKYPHHDLLALHWVAIAEFFQHLSHLIFDLTLPGLYDLYFHQLEN